LQSDRDANGSYETTETIESFTIDNDGYADETPTTDASGNLTYDGVLRYRYDAWNRLVSVNKAYRDSSGNLQEGSTVVTMAYDGLGRRISRAVQNSADLDCTYHDYYAGQRVIETRNGSNQTLKQWVWGATYVDELIQVALNDDPDDTTKGSCGAVG
jgi:YD repeat-containing protein